jgi:tetratricopeptide (TPR) repeat protein
MILFNEEQFVRLANSLTFIVFLYQTIFGEQTPLQARDLALLALAKQLNEDFVSAKEYVKAFSGNFIPYVLVSGLINAGNAQETRRELQRLLGRKNSSTEAFFLDCCSCLRFREGKTKEALYLIDEALLCTTQQKDAFRTHKVMILQKIGLFKEALSCLLEVKEPNTALFCFVAGEMFRRNRQFEYALAYASKAYNMRRNMGKKERVLYESIQQLALIQDSRRNFGQALIFYEKLMRFLAMRHKAITLEKLGVMQNIVRVLLEKDNRKQTAKVQCTESDLSETVMTLCDKVDLVKSATAMIETEDVNKISLMWALVRTAPETILDALGPHD